MAVISSLLLLPPALSRRTITICSNSSSKSMAAKNQIDGETSNRVVVCGGGVIGVCTAYFLVKKGIAVTLVEKSAVACAASGKAGGFLAFDWCDGGPVAPLARASFNLHRSLAEELNGVESYGYRPLTTLSLTVTESKPGSGGFGLPDWVNGPAKGPSTIGTTQTTAQVHPQLFTRKLLSTATEKYGVEVVIGKLEEVRVESGRVDAVVLEGGRVIDTDKVVLAMGPWSSKFELLSSIFRVYGTKAHSIVLEPKEPNAITPHALFLTYHPSHGGEALDPEVYPRPTGEVYICGMSSQEEVPDDPDQVTSNPESIQVLKRVAKTVSSYLNEENALVKAEQACFLPGTDDGVPVIGEIPGIKGCYVATGHSCWGILNGPATGAALAELIVDGVATCVDLSRFSPSRFSKRRGRV
ncbi:PREDICTED: putative oxidoreductase TDA3 [Camelina sativa]|uniref:Oxidoreductase TDA3 n=1 Tax=Camelina sativa TaxID=90675 RepID=A0ABM0W176_CAMSA|nr:PREDICTED: putative oxidoreductase TDA3 [Camelina sativa]